MTTYVVTGVRHETREQEIEAATPHEAVGKYRERNPAFAPDFVEGERDEEDCPRIALPVVGICDGCARPILDGEPYGHGEDCLLCDGCEEEAMRDVAESADPKAGR